MSDNNIADALRWWREHIPGGPAGTSLLIGLGAYGAGRLGWNQAVETARSLFRKPGRAMVGGATAQEADANYNEAVDRLKEDSAFRKWLPRVAGMIGFALPMYLWSNKEAPYRGWFDWYPYSMAKRGSLGYNPVQDMGMNSYVNELDWNRPIHASDVIGLFKDDPHLADEPYARNMGISIVADAAATQHTKSPTLGGVFDSAVNKLESKLTFGGVTDVAVKTAVANGVSRLFTGAVGAMCDLSPQAQQKLVDAGTWAGAITAMLN